MWTSSALQNLPEIVFKNKFGLKKLSLSHNKISNIDKLNSGDFKSLESLNLSNNKLSRIPKLDLPNLERLFILGNNFQNIKDDTFSFINRLKIFHVNVNYMNHFPDNIFQNFKNIESIEISINPAIVNYSSLFSQISSSINRLTISVDETSMDYYEHEQAIENPLPCSTFIPDKALNHLYNLETLNFYNVNLNRITENLLQNQTILKLFNFQSNTLENTSWIELFKTSSSLEELHLSGLALKVIGQNLFEKQSRMLYIDLSKNLLSNLPENIFRNNNLLKTINLRNNNLTYLPDQIFKGLSNLINLDLYGNRLFNFHG